MSSSPEGKPWCARSDPRMNRAVEARLQNPNLSLYECLRIGGFDYAADDANALDSENITLAQRKNQLNRRLRSYRKRLSKAQEAKEAQHDEMKTASEPLTGRGDHQPQVSSNSSSMDFGFFDEPLSMHRLLRSSFNSLETIQGEDPTATSATEADADETNLSQVLNLTQQHDQGTAQAQPQAQAQAQPAHANQTSHHQAQSIFNLLSSWDALSTGQTIPVASSSSTLPLVPQRSDATSTNSMQAIYSSLPSALVDATATGNPTTGSAVVAGTSTSTQATSALSTLESLFQLASNPSVQPPARASASQDPPAFSTSTFAALPSPADATAQASLASLTAPSTQDQVVSSLAHGNVLTGRGGSLSDSMILSQLVSALQGQQPQQQQPDPRQDIALRLFEQEMQTVYERCMRNAGYTPQDTETTSAAYRNFIQAANQREQNRVQRLLGNRGSATGYNTNFNPGRGS